MNLKESVKTRLNDISASYVGMAAGIESRYKKLMVEKKKLMGLSADVKGSDPAMVRSDLAAVDRALKLLNTHILIFMEDLDILDTYSHKRALHTVEDWIVLTKSLHRTKFEHLLAPEDFGLCPRTPTNYEELLEYTPGPDAKEIDVHLAMTIKDFL